MGQSVSFVPYTVRVTRGEDNFVPLDRATGTAGGIPFPKWLNEYLQARSGDKSVDTDKQKMMRVSHFDQKTDNMSGILKTGDFGFTAELENIATGVIKRREREDCQLIPFFFRFDFKKGQNKGILLLQRYGIHGAKTVLENDLGAFLANKDSELKLSLHPIIDPKVIEQMLAGQLKEIQFISQEIPADIADKIKIDRAETQGTLKMVLTAKRNQRFWEGIVNVLRPMYQDGQCIEIHNVKYHEARLVVSIGGKQRTICKPSH